MLKNRAIHTYSIVAYDPESKSWGVAVASNFLAVGAYVPYAKAEVGAIATQANGNPSFGARGLALLEQGKTAGETLDMLLENDDKKEGRQVGVVDAQGRSATFTGKNTFPFGSGIAKTNYAIQGNSLTGEHTLFAIEEAFNKTTGTLAHRLYAAIKAGEESGGDSRGKQSASLLVVKEHAGYGGYNDHFLDLRVDDHTKPVEELGRLLKLHDLYLGSTPENEKIKIDTALTKQFQRIMHELGYYEGTETGNWDELTQNAFFNFTGVENLEERVNIKKQTIDPPALKFLKEKFLK